MFESSSFLIGCVFMKMDLELWGAETNIHRLSSQSGILRSTVTVKLWALLMLVNVISQAVPRHHLLGHIDGGEKVYLLSRQLSFFSLLVLILLKPSSPDYLFFLSNNFFSTFIVILLAFWILSLVPPVPASTYQTSKARTLPIKPASTYFFLFHAPSSSRMCNSKYCNS